MLRLQREVEEITPVQEENIKMQVRQAYSLTVLWVGCVRVSGDEV